MLTDFKSRLGSQCLERWGTHDKDVPAIALETQLGDVV